MPRRFFPLIRCREEAAILDAIGVAIDAGVDGVFLVGPWPAPSQHMTTARLGQIARGANRATAGRVRLGLGLLYRGPNLAEWVADEVEGSTIAMWWAEDALAPTSRVSAIPPGRGRRVSSATVLGPLEFFGGAQSEVPLETALVQSRECRVTTFVCHTHAPQVVRPRVRALNNETFTQRLGLARPVTLADVGEFLPHVDDFIVDTSYPGRDGVLDPQLTRDLSERIHVAEA